MARQRLEEAHMPSELTVRTVHEGGMRMVASCGEHALTMDYPLQPEQELSGPRPLEVLLASLSACSGSGLAMLLERGGQQVSGLEVVATGQRRDEHPTVFTEIALAFTVRGQGLDQAAIERSLALCEGQLCPVWVMLKGATPITTSLHVVEEALV
jgi:putative redox protein